MATNWKSQQGDGMYSLQFETDDIDKYKLVEKASQMAIDGIAEADVVEVKHAFRTLNVGHRSYCSNCGGLAVCEKYCSLCGAKMDGGGKE